MSDAKSVGSSAVASSSSSYAAAGASSSVLSLDADENPHAGPTHATPQIITLVSKEGRRLAVSRQALMASELLKTTLEGDRDANEIPLYHIEGPIVQKVIDYLTYHLKIPPRKIEKPLVSSNMKDLVDAWDVNFIEGGEVLLPVGPNATPTPPSAGAQEVLFKLLLAANYLNIKSLLQLTCAKVGTLMKGRTPDQIRTVFNIRNDYTQAEEEEVRKEYRDLLG